MAIGEAELSPTFFRCRMTSVRLWHAGSAPSGLLAAAGTSALRLEADWFGMGWIYKTAVP